jgi:hypothetical protein
MGKSGLKTTIPNDVVQISVEISSAQLTGEVSLSMLAESDAVVQ